MLARRAGRLAADVVFGIRASLLLGDRLAEHLLGCWGRGCDQPSSAASHGRRALRARATHLDGRFPMNVAEGAPRIVAVEHGSAFWDDIGPVRACLGEPVPRIPPWFGYDEVGSQLFEQITELPTYYLTRVERGPARPALPGDRRADRRPPAWWSWAAAAPRRPGCCWRHAPRSARRPTCRST